MTSQPPDPETIKRGVAAVFDRGADAYDHVGVDFFTPPARDLVARAGLREGERVLDVGTGRGAVLFAAAEAVGPSGRAVGIDLSPRMAELTQAEAKARGLEQVTTLQGDAERPDFADASFDAVLAGLVIFFLPNAAAALQRYRALLTPEGRLGFTTFGPQDVNFDGAMRVLGQYIPGDPPDRGQRQGPFRFREGIVQILTENGFGHPQIDEMTYESRFTDADHWLTWIWSHGGRYTLERVPAERLDEATTAAKAAFESARTPAGDYAIYTQIRFTIARPA
jgi:ubiquinone/menaquinone biosynthesis C-methylase UbiE